MGRAICAESKISAAPLRAVYSGIAIPGCDVGAQVKASRPAGRRVGISLLGIKQATPTSDAPQPCAPTPPASPSANPPPNFFRHQPPGQGSPAARCRRNPRLALAVHAVLLPAAAVAAVVYFAADYEGPSAQRRLLQRQLWAPRGASSGWGERGREESGGTGAREWKCERWGKEAV